MSEAFRTYNDHKSGVDLADRFACEYIYVHKKTRWTKAAFLYLVKVALANAWILYKLRNNINVCQRVFF